MQNEYKKILQHVYRQPKWWKAVPWLNKERASTIYPKIYLRNDIFNDAMSNDPSPETIAILLHEEVHYMREKEMGLLTYGAKYFLDSTFRLEEEVIAMAPQFKYLKSRGLKYNFDAKARELSGATYLWVATFTDAKQKIINLWKSV